MKTKLIILVIAVIISNSNNAQKVITTSNGEITFFSSAPLEDIKATNQRVSAAMNTDNGEIMVRIQIRDFEFRKSLMQKHFNENYMESDQFPEALLLGKVINFNMDDLSGTNTYRVKGKLTIRDITQDLDTEVTIKKEGEQLVCESVFPVVLADYDIKIPRIMMRNIAEVVEVTANLVLE